MRRRRRWPWISAAIMVPVVVAGGTVWALRTQGSPAETTDAFLAAWARQDYPAMKALTADPPATFESAYRRFRTDLKLTRATFTRVGETGFRARTQGARDWTYDGKLTVVDKDRRWQVAWTPAAIHPALNGERRIKAVRHEQPSTPILAADGTRIDGPDAPGSVQQLVEGIRSTFPDRFGTAASVEIDLMDGERVVQPLVRTETETTPLKTTLDLRVHRAGADALDGVKKPASLVALRPSTGEILAVVNKPGGFNRALLGKYPPGSTFKIVTASALVADGTAPDKTVTCPPEKNIGGFPFHNAEFHDYGTLSFRDAFAHSCNTPFGAMGADELGDGRLGEVAAGFGFGAPITPGVPAVRADFPAPRDATDLASASIGQGRVLASPLNMASVAAAIADGSWRPPRLVPADLLSAAKPRRLEA
ncbi:MAG: cell division protein FtsI, partial [Nonomuraea sp.]|nr:cell division protein FtsI [Nonomuraea sp.]